MPPQQSPSGAEAPRPDAGAAAGLSIVVPLYNEAAGLPVSTGRICAVAARLAAARGLSCEIVYVDDGSRDASLGVARTLPADSVDVQVVSLSRNFGKEAALLAGLDHARLGAVLFMDGDGQHPPQLMETLVGHWLDGGHDVVFTAKAHRENEPALLRVAVKAFYSLVNWGARQKIPRMPAISACCRRAPPPHCGNCRSVIAFSKGLRPGSAFASCASTTSRPNAPMDAPVGA